MAKKKILVVDDQESFAYQIKTNLEKEGWKVKVANDGLRALVILKNDTFNIVLTDVKMPNMDGMELLKNIKATYPDIEVIVMTAFGSIETAVNAMKLGASDYITKPFSPEELIMVTSLVAEKQNLADEIKVLRKEIEGRYKFNNIIGKNHKMIELYDLISDVAVTDATVIIYGETGTGKELVAKSIHFNSNRKNNRFVGINCGGLPETLLESELFGFEEGAFTGASKQKIGKFELANKGTLFFDEIGDISQSMQVKLLRVLQEKEFERVGGNKTIKADVRIIAATNKILEEEVSNGRFREDLYYRLNVLPIMIPPLRERIEDIPLLVDHFIKKHSASINKNIIGITQDVMNSLMLYNWPGNIRQLENLIERAVIMSKSDKIAEINLTDNIIRSGMADPVITTEDINIDIPFKVGKTKIIEQYEKEYFRKLLKYFKGNITLSSKKSQIDMKTIHRKMTDYNLKKDDFKDENQ